MADRPPIPPGEPAAPPPSRMARLLAPRVALPALAVVLALAILLTPQPDTGRTGDARLTTRSTAPQGAQGLWEVARRLGWRAARQETPLEGALDTTAIYAVLDPPIDLERAETHRLLDAVRRGAALLTVLGGRSALADSLKLRAGTGRPMAIDPDDFAEACEGIDAGGLLTWGGGRPWLYAITRRGPAPPGGDTVFVRVEPVEREARRRSPAADSARPAAIGFPLGRGRVVAIADPDLLRNDVIRRCDWNAGLTAVRMLEWLGAREGAAPRTRIVFDEYHQGFGRHASATRAMGEFLTRTAPGRATLALVVAALLLLAAAAPRPVAPSGIERFERRSPYEHVGALSRAYAQVGATRTATRRLVRGLRRRHAHGAWRATSDEAFLQSIAARHPAVGADVRRVLAATATRVPPPEFAEVGRALESIERTLLER